MKLSRNLTLSEVTASDTAKRKGIENIPNAFQVNCLRTIAEKIFQPLRTALNTPIFISSGFRSRKLNIAIGGSSTSQHCKGEALDLDADRFGGVTNKDIFDFIKDNLCFDQLIWEAGTNKNPAWVHVSYVNDEVNRNKILVMYKDGVGRTKYKNFS
jgi:hypothetical protein